MLIALRQGDVGDRARVVPVAHPGDPAPIVIGQIVPRVDGIEVSTPVDPVRLLLGNIGEVDIIQQNMAKTAIVPVDDLYLGLLADKFSHVPGRPASCSLFGPVELRTILPSTTRLTVVSVERGEPGYRQPGTGPR